MRAREPERGGAYLLALAVVVVLSGLGIVLSETAASERRLGAADRDRVQALNAAESGLALATAGLLAGQSPVTGGVEFGTVRSSGAVRSSRALADEPVVRAVGRCETCAAPSESPGRVSYALSAEGEVVLRGRGEVERPARIIARAGVEALVTLQPWPRPGSSAGSEAGGPPCSPEQRRRVYDVLARELHPEACRFAPLRLAVEGLDGETRRVCRVLLPVCVLLTDWKER